MVAVARHNDPPTDPKKSSEIAADMPGLSPAVELSVTDRESPTTIGWVSDRLLARTSDGWSRAYERPVATQEAMEILMNVKRFAELLVRTKEECKI